MGDSSFPYYVTEFVCLENGKKFSFQNHDYLKELYFEHHPDITVQKATQMSITTWAFIWSIWMCKTALPLGVIYYFPTQTDVRDFSRGRITPFLNYNPQIQMQEDETDNVGIKKIGNAFFYLRGMKTAVSVKSVPADCLVFDEVDEADPVALEMAMKRIDHSDFRYVKKLSNPTIEGYGINRDFNETDQRYWHIKCGCGAWTCLDKSFPECLQRQGSGDVIRACDKCGRNLDVTKGEWVADFPSKKEKRGYMISQLISHYVPPVVILNEFEKKRGFELEQFYRLRLGRAYTIAQNRLTKQQILDKMADEAIKMPEGSHNFMGVDQGNDLHVTLIRPGVIHKLLILKDFEDLDAVMKEERVACCVIDALPETRKAKEFRDRNKGKVYLNYYNDNQKGDYKWNDKEKEYEVQVNRTESMDSSHANLKSDCFFINPDADNIDEFATQCSNVARKIEENPETGTQRYIWVKTGADHFRHSFNYACIAMSRKQFQPRVRTV